MEIIATLQKPYTDKERNDFIVEYNHNQGYTTKETDEALLAIQPDPHVPTYEEIDKAREDYRKEHIDSKTTMRSRKMANGSWTEEDEQAYLILDTEVTAWIEENLPYPEDESDESGESF